MNSSLRRRVWQRASSLCEYCQMPSQFYLAPFQIDHVIAEQHGGSTTFGNLALACYHCNLHKGPNLTGFDPDSAAVCRLFHPRQDVWREHFKVAGAIILGITPCGRTTVWVMEMNSEVQLLQREEF